MNLKNKSIDCSIIIVNYNTSQFIIGLLDSIKKYNTIFSYETIIIDNASPKDDLGELAHRHPEARIIMNDKNEGFGRANNLGIIKANGDYLLLLNSDTLLKDNALDLCLEFMNSEFAVTNNIGLMGCQLLNMDGSFQPSTFDEFVLWKYLISSNNLLNKFFQKQESKQSPISGFVPAVSGAFMMFRKEVFEKVKPFDPDIFMYSEETELCRERVGKHFNIYYWTGASVIHFGGGSTGNNMQLQEMVSYSLTWYKKGIFLYFIYLISLVFNSLTEFFLLPVMKPDNRQRSWNRLKIYPQLGFYLLFRIPWATSSWGGRKNPLKAI